MCPTIEPKNKKKKKKYKMTVTLQISICVIKKVTGENSRECLTLEKQSKKDKMNLFTL